MDTWTLKKGYPVVMIDRDYENNKAKLTQKWFLLNPEKQYAIEGTQKWYIPFTHTTQRGLINSFTFEAAPYWLKPEDNDGIKIRIGLDKSSIYNSSNLSDYKFER